MFSGYFHSFIFYIFLIFVCHIPYAQNVEDTLIIGNGLIGKADHIHAGIPVQSVDSVFYFCYLSWKEKDTNELENKILFFKGLHDYYPTHYYLSFLLGNLHFKKNDFLSASKSYSEALKKDSVIYPEMKLKFFASLEQLYFQEIITIDSLLSNCHYLYQYLAYLNESENSKNQFDTILQYYCFVCNAIFEDLTFNFQLHDSANFYISEIILFAKKHPESKFEVDIEKKLFITKSQIPNNLTIKIQNEINGNFLTIKSKGENPILRKSFSVSKENCFKNFIDAALLFIN